ncbi:DUF1045 domain-containing protein [Clavibacter zhangzhiyongii]|uniref:DUF1045 domain-containing protein n=2 Tax=Clavibacter zhangzhiyongii TaxID=2768071 RepID=A0A7L7Z2Y6_9MICO|nr:DUF1045 domain-containing protein [Clavibacter zhangzhiyongii]QOD44072.1 DUF1045 domain-containing protein [Clavibacter zhangzhiyongii]
MTRVAVYAVPGIGSDDAAGILLRERAEAWLGRSVVGGSAAPAPEAPAGWTRAEVDALTVDARRYGFHGTLKPPFRLADGRDLDELDAAVARFAAERERITVPGLRVTPLGDFLALVPTRHAPELHALAEDVVTRLDVFRAPPTDAETARRDPASLTPRQRELLAAWGYPHVLDGFRFHLTLTDRIPAAERPRAEAALAAWFAGCTDRPLAVDALAVLIEDAPGSPFRLHAVHPLRDLPTPHAPGAALDGTSPALPLPHIPGAALDGTSPDLPLPHIPGAAPAPDPEGTR